MRWISKVGGSNPQKNKIPYFACKGLKAGNSMKYNVLSSPPEKRGVERYPIRWGKRISDYFSKRELGLNLMTFLAARVIFSPVLGFTP